MKTAKRQRRRRLGLFGAFSAVLLGATAAATGAGVSTALGGTTGAASTGKADYSLSVSPSSQSVQLGKSVAYTVTVTATNGFTGSVGLAATTKTSSGATASGVTTSFTPSSLSMTSAGSIQTSTLTVAASRSAALGDVLLTITATSGKTVRSTSATLKVEKTPGSLSISASPSSVNVAPGSIAALSITLSRTGSMNDQAVTLSVSGAPQGTTATFNPTTTTGTSSTLQLAVPSTAKTGTYTLTITGTADGQTYTAGAALNVVYDARSFDISGGAASALAPGLTSPLLLTLTNPNKRDVSITNISAVVSTIKAECLADNFALKQYTGTYPLVLPAGATRTLQQLVEAAFPTLDPSVRVGYLPTLSMLNLDRNQDGCKAPTAITLTYSGSGTGD